MHTERGERVGQALVGHGLPTKQIAERVSISKSGVKKHLQLIYAKLGAASRSEAVAIALRRQLLKLQDAYLPASGQ